MIFKTGHNVSSGKSTFFLKIFTINAEVIFCSYKQLQQCKNFLQYVKILLTNFIKIETTVAVTMWYVFGNFQEHYYVAYTDTIFSFPAIVQIAMIAFLKAVIFC